MVSAIENLTRIDGTISGRSPHPELAGWDLVTVVVDHAEGVVGKADLVSARTAEPLRVAVRRELLGDAGAGWRLSGRVRLTQNGLRAEPYPQETDWRVYQAQSST
jgi:hypothetical protein